MLWPLQAKLLRLERKTELRGIATFNHWWTLGWFTLAGIGLLLIPAKMMAWMSFSQDYDYGVHERRLGRLAGALFLGCAVLLHIQRSQAHELILWVARGESYYLANLAITSLVLVGVAAGGEWRDDSLPFNMFNTLSIPALVSCLLALVTWLMVL